MWSLRICGDRISPLQSEDSVEVKGLSSAWLLCFSNLQLEFQKKVKVNSLTYLNIEGYSKIKVLLEAHDRG